jgi:hypothetical protein
MNYFRNAKKSEITKAGFSGEGALLLYFCSLIELPLATVNVAVSVALSSELGGLTNIYEAAQFFLRHQQPTRHPYGRADN